MAISNTDNVIDSREVIERIEELQDELTLDMTDVEDVLKLKDIDPASVQELADLLKLQEEAEDYAPDWKHGTTLIHEDYFVKYCEEVCKDIGDIPSNIPDYLVIDWVATAENMRVDYASVEFGDTTYYVR